MHTISTMSGRNRTTFQLSDKLNKFHIELTSITTPQEQPTMRVLTDADHIFYVVPLCSYCARLGGPLVRSQMSAHIELFFLLSRLDVLSDTPVTMFFTQADVFAQRIIDVPVRNTFASFDGETDAQRAFQYFVKQFVVRYRGSAPLRVFAPGLGGLTSLQDALDAVETLILFNICSKQRIGQDLGEKK